MLRKLFFEICITITVGFLANPGQASLTTDLQGLVAEGATLNNTLAAVNIGQGSSCTQLGTVNISIGEFRLEIESVTARLTSSISLTGDDMTSLDDLSAITYAMAGEAVRLSWELRSIEDVAELFEYRATLSAMLQLSEDIGTMANRILEMADRILVMADNIGEMADRILITQELQNVNVALTQASVLTAQQNMVALSDSLSSIAYNMSLGLVLDDTESLADEMELVTLTSENMAAELDHLQTITSLLVGSTDDLFGWMTDVSRTASQYINGDTLAYLGDLSALHTALAVSLNAYTGTIELLAPLTEIPVLSEATASMLQLTADIGVMSDRIMEMADKIIVMADNIGLMADRIVETQELQHTNMKLTESSLLSAQNTTITVIQDMGL